MPASGPSVKQHRIRELTGDKMGSFYTVHEVLITSILAWFAFPPTEAGKL